MLERRVSRELISSSEGKQLSTIKKFSKGIRERKISNFFFWRIFEKIRLKNEAEIFLCAREFKSRRPISFFDISKDKKRTFFPNFSCFAAELIRKEVFPSPGRDPTTKTLGEEKFPSINESNCLIPVKTNLFVSRLREICSISRSINLLPLIPLWVTFSLICKQREFISL